MSGDARVTWMRHLTGLVTGVLAYAPVRWWSVADRGRQARISLDPMRDPFRMRLMVDEIGPQIKPTDTRQRKWS